MLRRPPRSKRTDTLFPYTTLCRSHLAGRRINTSPPRRRGPLEVYAATKGRADHGRVQRHVTLKRPSRGRRFSASVLPQSRNPAALAHRDERLADLPEPRPRLLSPLETGRPPCREKVWSYV